MLKRRIIPCLDIKNGRVVKGVHFAGLRDAGDPVEAARAYDRQGADEGPQYRSVIFYHSDAQLDAARRSLQAAQADFEDPIVTVIQEADTFWVAEDKHQNYYRLNRDQGYCRVVIAPKLDKLGLEK